MAEACSLPLRQYKIFEMPDPQVTNLLVRGYGLIRLLKVVKSGVPNAASVSFKIGRKYRIKSCGANTEINKARKISRRHVILSQ